MSWDFEMDEVPPQGQRMGDAQAEGLFVSLLRKNGLENNLANRQLIYSMLPAPAADTFWRQAQRNHWGPQQLDERLERLAGETGAEEGSPTFVSEIKVTL